MRIDIFHHFPGDGSPIVDLLTAIKQEIHQMSSQTQAALARLQADVAAQKTVIDGASTLLASLAQLIRDNASDPTALNALADQLETQTQGLSKAVTDNTPAAGDTGGSGSGDITPPVGGPVL